MNSLQAAVLGVVLLIVGFAAIAFGGYELYEVWQYKQDLAQADSAVGGLLGSLTQALGADLAPQYQTSSIAFVCTGIVSAVLGWLALGKVKS